MLKVFIIIKDKIVYSNEVIVLDVVHGSIVHRLQMTQAKGSFSGGNAISEDGSTLAISVRGENKIYIYEIENGNLIRLKDSFACGAMPRDVLIKKNHLFVNCTQDNRIEVYDLNDEKLISSIAVHQPITFALK